MAETQETTEKVTLNNGSAPYPAETLNECVEICKLIYEAKGDAHVSLPEICAITGKARSTMVLRISACVQYGLLLNTYGKGYSITDLFTSIAKPEFDYTERIKRLEAFNNPPLYKKLIERYNSKTLPTVQGLANILSDYSVHANSTIKAAAAFLENCSDLSINENGRLRYFIPNPSEGNGIKKKEEEGVSDTPVRNTPPARKEDEVMEDETVIIIPLKQGEKKARLILPNGFDVKDLTRIEKFVNALKDE